MTSELLDAKTKESRFFLREFQLMASTSDDNALSSDLIIRPRHQSVFDVGGD